MVSTAKAVDLQVPVTLQPQYSLLSRENEREIVPAAVNNGIGLLPWSPLADGFLTGKYQRGGAAAGGTRAGSERKGIALYVLLNPVRWAFRIVERGRSCGRS
jgi:aryl-alcohol dehydrogenase (NADP+)